MKFTIKLDTFRAVQIDREANSARVSLVVGSVPVHSILLSPDQAATAADALTLVAEEIQARAAA